MSSINLTQRDADLIARVVETEVPGWIADRDPQTYDAMVKAVTDTIINRVAAPAFPDTVEGVLNQDRAFSKINGPQSYRDANGRLIQLNPYGSAAKAPKASAAVEGLVFSHVGARANGAPSTVGTGLHYANPHFSSPGNQGWINALDGPRLGVGDSIHYHGTDPNMRPAPEGIRVSLNGQGGASPMMAALTPDRLPTPQPRYERGGILAKHEAGSLNPVSTAQAAPPIMRPPTPAPAPSIAQQASANYAAAQARRTAANAEPVAPNQAVYRAPVTRPAPPSPSSFAYMASLPGYATDITTASVNPLTSVAGATLTAPVAPPAAPPPPAPGQRPTNPLAPPRPPERPPTGSDVWNGKSNYGVATGGYELFRQNNGNVLRYSPKYDRTTVVKPGGKTGNVFDGRVEVEPTPRYSNPFGGGVESGNFVKNRVLPGAIGFAAGGIPGVAAALLAPFVRDAVAQIKGGQSLFPPPPQSLFPNAPAPLRNSGVSQQDAERRIREAESGGRITSKTANAIRTGQGGLF